MQSGSKKTWIVCGVIAAVVVVCGGIALVLGGVGVLAALSEDEKILDRVLGQEVEMPYDGEKEILFQDEFSGPSSGLPEESNDGADYWYDSGEYFITVKQDNWMAWSKYDERLADAIITSSMAVVEPTGLGDYGLICRYQDEDNFYAFEVSEDGYYGIWKSENAETVMIQDWIYSEIIPEYEPITMEASCIGNHLRLVVNGTMLAEVTDESFSEGSYGVIVGTVDDPGLTVAFDTITVFKP